MGTYSDDIGVWNDLGSVVPSLYDWLKFPTISNGAHNTFRLKITCPQPQKINSYILLRSRFTTANSDQVEEAKRIYPKSHTQEKLLFRIPLNQELMDRTIYLRSIEIKKVYVRTKYLGITTDVDYSVYLEELWG